MITVNQMPYERAFFPDGTQRLKIDPDLSKVSIGWYYENDSELFTVLAIAQSYRELGVLVSLFLPYIPNARMDRVKSKAEVFTLKVFARLINQAGFTKVTVLDAHSNVAPALLDRVRSVDVAGVIRQAALQYLPEDLILYFPDEGSKKRYADLFPEYRFVTGMKVRDWSTGQIKGLQVLCDGVELEGKTILMIDDIIAYGGSFYYSALKLKELGAGKIYAYATHTENSVLDEEKGTLLKLLNNKTVERLFTTNSVFTGNRDDIQVTEVQSYEETN